MWTITVTTSETEVGEKYGFSQDQVNLAFEIIDKLESSHLVKKDYRSVKSDSFEIFIKLSEVGFSKSLSDSFTIG